MRLLLSFAFMIFSWVAFAQSGSEKESNMYCVERSVMDPKSWTRKRPFLRWSAALKMKERQCPEHARITRPA